jgi:hypothetical protein
MNSALPDTSTETINAARLGFWAALLSAVLAVVSFSIAVTAVPISGPFCPADCVAYPFTNVAAYVPHDYIWMYPAMLMIMVFVVMMGALDGATTGERRVYARVALNFALITATLILADYYIQIAVMQPSILRGENEGLALLTQYNPHGVFIALEDLGYFLMGVSFIFGAFIFAGRRGLERALFWVFLLGGTAAILAYFAYYAIYGTQLEYRYEVAAISIDWFMLLVTGVLLSIWFRRQLRAART